MITCVISKTLLKRIPSNCEIVHFRTNNMSLGKTVKTIYCRVCNKFVSHGRQHISNNHVTVVGFKCPNGDYTSKRKSHVDGHIRRKHDTQNCTVGPSKGFEAELKKWTKICFGDEEKSIQYR